MKNTTTAHALLAIEGDLYFPTGANSDPNTPSLLLRRYDSGDCDTCPWPMVSEFRDEAELMEALAMSLYDERETNPTFGTSDTVLLPDGTPFDFDAILSSPAPRGLSNEYLEQFPDPTDIAEMEANKEIDNGNSR